MSSRQSLDYRGGKSRGQDYRQRGVVRARPARSVAHHRARRVPHNESQMIHPNQQLSGSALRLIYAKDAPRQGCGCDPQTRLPTTRGAQHARKSSQGAGRRRSWCARPDPLPPTSSPTGTRKPSLPWSSMRRLIQLRDASPFLLQVGHDDSRHVEHTHAQFLWFRREPWRCPQNSFHGGRPLLPQPLH
jgi:hypothetical protein